MPHAMQIRQTGGPEVLNEGRRSAGLCRSSSRPIVLRSRMLLTPTRHWQRAQPRLRHPDHLTRYPQEFAMSKTAITSPELAPPVGPFSQAIEVGGFLYFSGQVAQDPATGKVVEGGIVAETERVFRNLSAVLKAAGKSFDDVVRAGVFLANMSDYAAMNG